MRSSVVPTTCLEQVIIGATSQLGGGSVRARVVTYLAEGLEIPT